MGCDTLELPTTSSLDVSSMVNADVNLPRDITLQDFTSKSANPGLDDSVKSVSDLVKTKSIANNSLGETMGPTALLEQTTSGVQNVGSELTKTLEDCFKSITSLRGQLEKLLSKQIDLDINVQDELNKLISLFPNSPAAIIGMIRDSFSLSIDIPGLSVLNGLNLCADAYLNEAAGLLSDIRKLACGSVDKLTPKAKLDMVKDPALATTNISVIQDGINVQMTDSIKTGKGVSTEPPVVNLPGLSTPPIVPAGTVGQDTKASPDQKATQSAQETTQSETLDVKQAVSTGCYDFINDWVMAANIHVSNMMGQYYDLYWPEIFIKRSLVNKRDAEAYKLITKVCEQYVEMLVARWFFSTHWDSGPCDTKSSGMTPNTTVVGSGNPMFQTPDRTLKQLLGIWKWSDFSDTNKTGVNVPSSGTLPVINSRFELIVEELFALNHWSKPIIRDISTVKTGLTQTWGLNVFTNFSTLDQSELPSALENFKAAADEPLVRRLIRNRKEDEMNKMQSLSLTQMSERVRAILEDDTKILGVFKGFSVTDKAIPNDTIYHVGTFDWNQKQVTSVELLSGSPGDYLNW